ncbi:AAA family ATPase [Synechococcus elongatus]|uniref:AAA family ATPase n=1 Tax=Synechococcus elongatus TaxID=32046 RepID=UPI0030CE6AFA
MNESNFSTLDELATYLRHLLDSKRYILLYAYNGMGKTRLSMTFKNIGKQENQQDTLYFNAFTEDLFTWDNDLDNDTDRVLKLNSNSRFFAGLDQLEMENRIRPFLHRYADFSFRIDYQAWTVTFAREVNIEGRNRTIDNIKISRGEENIFIWCFFLVIVQLAMDGVEAYQWVKYIYIDDPISSLDEHNAITVGNHLAGFLKRADHAIKVVISSHYPLFFNVLWNELREINRSKFKSYFLFYSKRINEYTLSDLSDTPFFHHLALLQDIWKAKETGEIYTHHFNALRSLLEKASTFHGYKKFTVCLEPYNDDPDETLYGRIVNVLSHGNYSFYDPVEMLPDNKEFFEKILTDFLQFYSFNSELMPAVRDQEITS